MFRGPIWNPAKLTFFCKFIDAVLWGKGTVTSYPLDFTKLMHKSPKTDSGFL